MKAGGCRNPNAYLERLPARFGIGLLIADNELGASGVANALYKSVTAAIKFVAVPVKSLNLRDELPELMTSTDAMNSEHVAPACKENCSASTRSLHSVRMGARFRRGIGRPT